MAARKRGHSEDNAGVDRLSDLPDEILGHILSFLPTKKAVQTSALSKRWKGVFSLATGLEFDDFYERKPSINFVDRVLSLHKVSIRRFKLNVWILDQIDSSSANAWIASALSLGAQELDLELRYQMDDMTQHKLLNSCTMTVLKLKYNHVPVILKVPMSVCLSSLRVLNLERIIFPDVNSTSRFFLGCSSLTDLTLSSCVWMDGQVYSVSCPKLRNLTIYDPGYHKVHNNTKTPTIELDIPVVVYFKCCSIPQKLFHIKNPVLICTAEFQFRESISYDKTDVFFIRLMRQLSNVKVLRLFGEALTVISRIKLSKLPTTFVNLTRLEVGSRYGRQRNGWRRLPELIARSPLLETLVFKEGLKAIYSDLVVFLDDQRELISKNHITIQVDGY